MALLYPTRPLRGDILKLELHASVSVIIGGGISGLSTAYYLAKAGIPSTLIERERRLGGVILTEHVEGCLLEAGPDSFVTFKPARSCADQGNRPRRPGHRLE